MAQENLQKLYKQALESLAQGQAPQAQKDLEYIYSQGWRSEGLEHYLGRALVANKDYAQGLWHLYQALNTERLDSDLRTDIALSEKLVASDRGTKMEHPSEWAFSLSTFIKAEEQLFLAATLLCSLFAWHYFKALKKKQWIIGLLAVLLLSAMSLFSFYGKNFALIKSNIEIKAAPLEAAETVAEAGNGTRVRILRKNENFSEVERVGSFRGWVANGNLLKL